MSESEAKRLSVQRWVRRADEDLGLAQLALSDREFYLQGIGFHCQQAAEKMLKAFLTWEEAAFPKTHNLLALLDLCVSLDPGFAELVSACDRLNPLSVETRYGDLPVLQDPAEADEVLALARQVHALVSSRLANRGW